MKISQDLIWRVICFVSRIICFLKQTSPRQRQNFGTVKHFLITRAVGVDWQLVIRAVGVEWHFAKSV